MRRNNEPAPAGSSPTEKIREIPTQLSILTSSITHLESTISMLHTELADAGILVARPTADKELCRQDENVCSEMGRTIQGMTISVNNAHERIVYLLQSLAI